ncbi:MAG: DNA mismatch repair protein MutS, partial [Gemmatimonadaceae bacterium]
AICEQIEDPKVAKGIVKRAVVETITPGAAFSDDLLDASRNTFLAALALVHDQVGLAAADLSTGEFRLVRCTRADLDAVLARLAPRELLVATGVSLEGVAPADDRLTTPREGWEFDPALARDALVQHFGVASLEGFGLEAMGDAPAIGAAGALLRYLKELQPGGVPHLMRPTIERPGGVMPLDEMTRRNLELVESMRATDDLSGTLLGVLDHTQTPMGARLLRQWILAPLTEVAAITARLDAVQSLVDDALAREALRTALDGVRDIERLAGRTAALRATPRDLRALGDSLARLPEVHRALLRIERRGTVAAIAEGWDDAASIAVEIQRTLVERPPLSYGEGETVAAGIDTTLDELRAIAAGGKDAIAGLQAAERERTGIASLKVGYNRVFGYFIEVTNAHKASIPDDYQRRQTLTGAERYITPALKAFEEKVLHATERMEVLERELVESLRARVGGEIARLQAIARRCAALDVVASLAEVAAREGYVRPVVDDGASLEIVRGRHPVVERMMPRDRFVPNDVTLTPEARLIILTGPNMAGKSTILRQIGLIVLMAQMGSYVPAASARIGVADRVFTRVGASDNLVRGQSTFMVEMAETSAILHTATARSLVLLDEIGRGTATWDGLSIAWAVSEHLHERVGCKTVFATHYHELTQLADEFDSVRNFNVAVQEAGDRIVFLHRLMEGGADRSYGIEVGRLAGLPDPVIARARALLRVLEGEQIVPALGSVAPSGKKPSNSQHQKAIHKPASSQPELGLFAPPVSAAPNPVVERLAAVDINALTPLQALALSAERAAAARGDDATEVGPAARPR